MKKNILFIFCFILLFSCCNSNDNTLDAVVTITEKSYNTDIKILDYYEAKYSSIVGYAIIDNYNYYFDNGQDGYYYKSYNLPNHGFVKGNVILITKTTTYNSYYKVIIEKHIKIDFSQFEIKQ